MICPQCTTRNPIGNKFCRECGARLHAPGDALADEEAARADQERREERLAVLLADAIALAERGKFYDALPLAEEAAQLVPASTSAQALLASLYERTGQTRKAIAAMETVVALNPESAADQAKLDQLRRGVHVQPVPVARSGALPPWAPVVAAGAVGAFVLGIGLSLLPAAGGRETRRVAASTSGSTPVQYAPALVSPPSGEATTIAPSPATRADPFAPVSGEAAEAALPAPPPGTAGASRPVRRVSRPSSETSGPSATASPSAAPLPALTASGEDARPASVPPRFRYRPPRATTGQAPSRSLPPLDPGTYIAVSPPAPGGRIAVAPPPAPPRTMQVEERPTGGYIRIRVSAPPAEAAPVPEPSGGAASEGDPLLRAQSLQAAGRYADAAAAYRQAAASLSGRAAGEAYQAMALCQQRLGNAEAARAAYRQAIAAFEAQAATGREVAAARQGIASCRAALEVLGNG